MHKIKDTLRGIFFVRLFMQEIHRLWDFKQLKSRGLMFYVTLKASHRLALLSIFFFGCNLQQYFAYKCIYIYAFSAFARPITHGECLGITFLIAQYEHIR